MKTKAFTLVELIVVITILAILGTIAFISLSGYSKEARDAKRITDTSSLLSKINIEHTRGTPLSDLITATEDAYLQILGNSGSLVKTFGKADFKTLKEDEKNFRDPSNKSQNYPMAYAFGGSGRDAYRFIQIATISEKENKAVIKGNYYTLDNSDAPSLFLTGGITQEDGKVLENGGEILPYPPTSGGNTGGGNTSGGGGQKFSCTGTLPDNIETFNTDNLTADTAYQNTNDSEKCYYKCMEGYVLDGDLCTLTHVGEVEVWIDPNTDFIREANPTGTYQWATNDSYPEPEWNEITKRYNYESLGRTEEDYPAFKACTDLGDGWRLPTKNELILLINYKTPNSLGAYSNHEGILPNNYWSAMSYNRMGTNAGFTFFNNAYTNYNNKVNFNHNVICIHSSSQKLDNWVHNPDASTETRFGNTTHIVNGIEAYQDIYLGNKYWQAKKFGNGDVVYAKNYCSKLGTGGWRMPTIEELYSLTTYTIQNTLGVYSSHPGITTGNFWASNIHAPITNRTRNVGFYHANTNATTSNHFYDIICIHD